MVDRGRFDVLVAFSGGRLVLHVGGRGRPRILQTMPCGTRGPLCQRADSEVNVAIITIRIRIIPIPVVSRVALLLFALPGKLVNYPNNSQYRILGSTGRNNYSQYRNYIRIRGQSKSIVPNTALLPSDSRQGCDQVRQASLTATVISATFDLVVAATSTP